MTTLLGGCAHQHALVADEHPLLASPSSSINPEIDVENESDTIAASMMLNELGIGFVDVRNESVDSSVPYELPQLVAGDWLAWQCAVVGGYWDMPNENAPAFAEAFEADLID
tara:strand:+ start:226831 stop:227166 length:336 start_codon:yes stop_codon:yes gene_type:complete